MSLQEMKEEFKQSEGDPHIKGKIRQLRQQRMKKRMMAAVPKASVIITNPTHYSVALSYDRGMSAPVCVAKGVDNIALQDPGNRQGARHSDRGERAAGPRAVCNRRDRRRDPGRALPCGRRNHRLRHGSEARLFRQAGVTGCAGNRHEMACNLRNSRLMDLRLRVRFRHSGAGARHSASSSCRQAAPPEMTAETDNDLARRAVRGPRAGAAERQHRAGAAGGRRHRRGRGRADDASAAPRRSPISSALLALLAMVGLFNLFAFAAGIIRFADRSRRRSGDGPHRRSRL